MKSKNRSHLEQNVLVMVSLENVVAGRVLPVVLPRGPPSCGLLLFPRPLLLLLVLNFLQSAIFFLCCSNSHYPSKNSQVAW